MLVVFSERGCEISKGEKCQIQGKPIVLVREENGMYKLNQIQKRETALTVINRKKQSLWHGRTQHLGYNNLKLWSDKMVVGIDFKDEGPPQCESCLTCKQSSHSRRLEL
jgi:hypothetical protein